MTDAIRGVSGAGESPGVNPSVGTKTGQSASSGEPSLAVADADSANVGQTQSLLETINATAAGIPDVNQGQVAAMRQAIANGTYKIDPQHVAKQLLNSDQALTGPTPGNE